MTTKSEPPSPRFSRPLKRAAKLVLLALSLLAIFLFFHLQLDRFLTITSMKENEAWVRGTYRQSPLATIAVYALLTVLYIVCSLPGAAVPMMIGGALFGVWLGTAVCAVSLSLGAIVSLLLARFIFRDFVRRRFARQATVVEREYRRSGTDYLIAMRLIPVMPYFLTNLVFGLTPISVTRFWIFSLVFSLPAVFLYGSAGTELAKVTSLGDILSPRLIATLLALAALPFVARFVTTRVLKVRTGPPPCAPSRASATESCDKPHR